MIEHKITVVWKIVQDSTGYTVSVLILRDWLESLLWTVSCRQLRWVGGYYIVLNCGHFPSNQKLQNFQNGEKWWGNLISKYPKFWKLLRSQKWSIQSKLQWKSQKERTFSINIFIWKFWYTSLPQKVVLFTANSKKWYSIHSPLEISRTDNWNFWFNGWHPVFFFTQETKVTNNLIFRQEPSNWQGFKLTPMSYLVFQCHNMPFNLGVLGQCRHNDVGHQPHWRLVWLYVVSVLFSNKSR